MASKSDFDEELSNGGESSKGNNTSLIVNVNDTQSDLEEQESLNYSDHEENESENESSEKKESEKKSSKKDDSSSSKKKKRFESFLLLTGQLIAICILQIRQSVEGFQEQLQR